MEGLTRTVPSVAQHRLSLRFLDRALEAEFLQQFAAGAVSHHRLVLPFVCVLFLGTGALDHLVYAGDALVLARWLRLGLGGVTLVAGVALGFVPQRRFAQLWQQLLAIGLAILLACLIVPLPYANAAAMHNMVFAIMLVMIGGYTLVNLRFVYASVVALAAGAALVAELAVIGPAHQPGGAVWDAAVWVVLVNAVGMFAGRQLESFRRDTFLQRHLLALERQRAEVLLENILPRSVAERLKAGDTQLVDGYDAVTVLFADLVGFTEMAAKLPPRELVHELNEIFTEFDAIARRFELEKIKTIGDAYMLVGGVPTPRADHAEAVAEMALSMLEALEAGRRASRHHLHVRIGIHTGPVVAGVIGTTKFSYDVWGDTVNTASRMQSHGVEDAIQVSETAHALLRASYEFEPRREVEVKGKGPMLAYVLRGRRSGRGRVPIARLGV